VDVAGRLRRIVREEMGAVDPLVLVARVVLRVLPAGLGNRTRVAILRTLGFRVGARTTIGSDILFLGGREARHNVTIGSDCYINQGCVIDATASVHIGRDVALGHQAGTASTSRSVGRARWSRARS
jgi:acetyltransferase-like isoleucine patch superfamily enzyme